MSKLHIAVLMGGDSAEREVSLHSGQAVMAGLDPAKYDILPVELTATPHSPADLPAVLHPDRIDLAFLALHGGGGEDGHIQAVLEQAHIPYTGSGPEASAQAMNKIITKQIFNAAGIATPRSRGYENIQTVDLSALAQAALAEFGLPLVVKPASQGSTIGISIVRQQSDLLSALELALRYDRDLLIEEFIAGMEITAAVLGNGTPRALPLIEIVPKSGFYDYEAKYIADDTDKICPARLSPALTEASQQAALAAHCALGCRGYSRVDIMIRGEHLYVLEVNTLPGMIGEHSLVPCAARVAGMNYSELLDEMIKLALETKGA
jgi:D-alanine-D-alanine ligase